MSKSKLFQYAILWHPTEKQVKEDGAKSKIIKDLSSVLAADTEIAKTLIAMDIPTEYKEQLEQIEILVRPF